MRKQYERQKAAKPRRHRDLAVQQALEKTLQEHPCEDVKRAAFMLLHQYINDIASESERLP